MGQFSPGCAAANAGCCISIQDRRKLRCMPIIQRNVTRCRSLGDLFQAEYKDAFFDVVLFNHSLEHMYNPVAILREVHRVLKPGGLLIINIPNAGSFEAWLFSEYWTQWSPPQHIFHFTKQTMA